MRETPDELLRAYLSRRYPIFIKTKYKEGKGVARVRFERNDGSYRRY